MQLLKLRITVNVCLYCLCMYGFEGDTMQTKGDKHTANYRWEQFTGGVVKVGQEQEVNKWALQCLYGMSELKIIIHQIYSCLNLFLIFLITWCHLVRIQEVPGRP